jgi:hypothetical protein
MSTTKKKVACIILGTSKNIDRLRVLVAGAIKCCNHDLFIKFVADGLRPDFIPKEWEWISAEHLKLTNNNAHPTSRRHAWAYFATTTSCWMSISFANLLRKKKAIQHAG